MVVAAVESDSPLADAPMREVGLWRVDVPASFGSELVAQSSSNGAPSSRTKLRAALLLEHGRQELHLILRSPLPSLTHDGNWNEV